MAERTDTERLEWMLDQNRQGYFMMAVTSRADVDSLMDDTSEPFPAPTPEETERP